MGGKCCQNWGFARGFNLVTVSCFKDTVNPCNCMLEIERQFFNQNNQ